MEFQNQIQNSKKWRKAQGLDFEERKPREEWDKRYFTKLTYWFEENFSKERISHIIAAKETAQVALR